MSDFDAGSNLARRGGSMSGQRKTLTFIRHGESLANAGGVTMAHAAIPLSTIGRQQVTELAALLDLVPSTVLVTAVLQARADMMNFSCSR
jgi:broad specificity phosphatase PhoE